MGERESERDALPQAKPCSTPSDVPHASSGLYLNEDGDTAAPFPLQTSNQGIWKSGRLTGKSPYDPNVIQKPIQTALFSSAIISTGV